MCDLDKKVAESLLQIKAIKLNPTNHFTWASGWYSPIYCDNRKILSYPAVRKEIYEGFVKIISEKYPDADIIAGVATGAIAHGVLVAEKMGKPFIYVRSSPKSHGLTNQVEGEYWPGAKVVVVEDEAHQIFKPQNSLVWNREFFGWLDKYLKHTETDSAQSPDSSKR